MHNLTVNEIQRFINWNRLIFEASKKNRGDKV